MSKPSSVAMGSFKTSRLLQAVLLGCLFLLVCLGFRGLATAQLQQDRTEPSALARLGLAGSPSCSPCHPGIARNYASSAMRYALLTPDDPRALGAKPSVSSSIGRARYKIEIVGGKPRYLVEYEGSRLALPIRWAFGLGQAGQTYVADLAGKLLESRVSYYDSLRGLDLTIGAANEAPSSLQSAAGREMNQADIRECFGCHALGVATAGQPVLDGIELGVGCESCHGPALAHVQARVAGNRTSGPMPSLKNQEAEEISQLCGGCHRTWEDVVEMRVRGINNVRFQPYRLTLSRCYDSGDARISCVACHDPHRPVLRGAANYDPRCQSCHHDAGKASGRLASCRAGRIANCTDCHMPKRELSGAHKLFADHYIQIPQKNGEYPDG